MSFFNELLGSIGTGQSPAPPKPLQKNVPTNPTRSSNPGVSMPLVRPSSTTQSTRDGTMLVTRPAVGPPTTLTSGMKRKAEGTLSGLPDKTLKSGDTKAALPSPPLPAPKDGKRPATPTSFPVLGQTRAPPKGSFADIMARAKAAQEQRGQNQVGMILHQASSKDKVPKQALQRRKEEDEKAKPEKSSSAHRAFASGRIEKRRSASPIKRSDQPKNLKTPRPPLAAPTSSYKGTMGQPSRRPPLLARNGKRPSKYDDYLGTDEEDVDDDDVVKEEDDYASDGSSDMEVGLADIDEEEAAALRKAKEDDAKELALESKLKREKEERRKRLEALANKRH